MTTRKIAEFAGWGRLTASGTRGGMRACDFRVRHGGEDTAAIERFPFLRAFAMWQGWGGLESC